MEDEKTRPRTPLSAESAGARRPPAPADRMFDDDSAVNPALRGDSRRAVAARATNSQHRDPVPSEPKPFNREGELIKDLMRCTSQGPRDAKWAGVTELVRDYRRELLSDPAVVLEAAEALMRKHGVASLHARVTGYGSVFTRLNLERSGPTIATAFAALVRARGEGSQGGG